MAALNTINKDCLLNIMKYLPDYSVMAMPIVCSRIRDKIQEHVRARRGEMLIHYRIGGVSGREGACVAASRDDFMTVKYYLAQTRFDSKSILRVLKKAVEHSSRDVFRGVVELWPRYSLNQNFNVTMICAARDSIMAGNVEMFELVVSVIPRDYKFDPSWLYNRAASTDNEKGMNWIAKKYTVGLEEMIKATAEWGLPHRFFSIPRTEVILCFDVFDSAREGFVERFVRDSSNECNNIYRWIDIMDTAITGLQETYIEGVIEGLENEEDAEHPDEVDKLIGYLQCYVDGENWEDDEEDNYRSCSCIICGRVREFRSRGGHCTVYDG